MTNSAEECAYELFSELCQKSYISPFLTIGNSDIIDTIAKVLTTTAQQAREEALREAMLVNCPACRGQMPGKALVPTLVRGDDAYQHFPVAAADNLYRCRSGGIRALMESE